MILIVRQGRFPGNCQGHVGVEFHQLAAQEGLLLIFLEVFALGRAIDLVHVREDVFQCAVLGKQIACCLGTDQGHAGHVVGRVADEGLVVNYLVRRHAPIALEDVAVHDLVAADVVDPDAVGDQLPAVLVAADDEALPAQLAHKPGDRRYDVVGLETFPGQQGNPQRVDQAVYEVDLWHEVFVHVGPARLVLLIQFVAKGLARQIEGAEEKVGLFGFQQEEEVAGKAIDRVDRLAAGAGHVRDGVENLVDEGMGINDPDGFVRETRWRGRCFRRRKRGLRPFVADRFGRRRCFLIEEGFLVPGNPFGHSQLVFIPPVVGPGL